MIGIVQAIENEWRQGGCLLHRSRLGILSILLFASGLSAAADSHLLKPSSIEEFIDSKEQISGSSTVGACYFSAKDQVREDRLYAYFNKPTSGNLLLKINSIDGRYASEIRYELKSPVSGWMHLEFPTQHKAFVRQYSTSEIAGLLTDSGNEMLFPLRWGNGADADTLRLYINAERARAFFYLEENGKKRAVYCTTPSLASGFKFNSICDVPVASIPEPAELNIHRKFGIRPVDPILVKLSLPDRRQSN